MGKQEINVNEELEKLESQIGNVIIASTQEEAVEVKKTIQRLVQNVEEILIYQAGIPRSNANRIVESLQENLNYSMGRNLTTVRESEYNETKENFATVERPELQSTSDELARFQNEGVVTKDNKYSTAISEICEEVIRDYRKKLESIGTRGSEDAYMDIKNKIGRTSNALQEIHEEHTRRIKQDISRRVGELGIKITSVVEQQIETEAEGVYGPVPKDDFASKLGAQTVSEAELAESDARALSENEKAFRGSEPRTTTRKDLEAMFK